MPASLAPSLIQNTSSLCDVTDRPFSHAVLLQGVLDSVIDQSLANIENLSFSLSVTDAGQVRNASPTPPNPL